MASAAYKNTDLKPTEVFDYPWLYCVDEEINKKYSKNITDADSWGKWMMFFDRTILDEKWSRACELYRENQLQGIASMKVSTNCENDRANDKNTGVLIFYCGPIADQLAIMEYGKNLLTKFPYEAEFGFMFYKSDQQTRLGTRATGQKKNYLYRLAVPKPKRRDSADQNGSDEKKKKID